MICLYLNSDVTLQYLFRLTTFYQSLDLANQLYCPEANQSTLPAKFENLHKDYSSSDFVNNQDFYLYGVGSPVAPEHVVLMRNGVMVDSSGVFTKTNDYDYNLAVSIDKAEDFLVNSLNDDNWNSWFDRPSVVPMIEKDLGIVCNINSNYNYGSCYFFYQVTDERKWMLTKVKYGI